MDVVRAMEKLGVDKEAYHLLGLLPLVYVAWADGEVQRAEREEIARIAERLGWLEGGGTELLERWLTTRPTSADLRQGIELLNYLASTHESSEGDIDSDLDADSLHLLLLLCEDVAKAARRHFGFGAQITTEEKAALEEIAATLDLEHATHWHALTKEHAQQE